MRATRIDFTCRHSAPFRVNNNLWPPCGLRAPLRKILSEVTQPGVEIRQKDELTSRESRFAVRWPGSLLLRWPYLVIASRGPCTLPLRDCIALHSVPLMHTETITIRSACTLFRVDPVFDSGRITRMGFSQDSLQYDYSSETKTQSRGVMIPMTPSGPTTVIQWQYAPFFTKY
ncbi:hypothetical protein EVAR_23159_1 [Eumeta japonica]|uniref:Uncharacterized protein n=1 Tax=Eumeta variegata TaxID=151549 RepID=A0A4C1VBL1_EUMVA|nr:hypothetical protein EVAR_23159_1 [Eumeta japonica]